MSVLAIQNMGGLVTQPYRRGAETLELTPVADAGGFTPIAAYDFREYKARYGQDPPEPKYVLYLKTDVPLSDVEVEVRYSFAGSEKSVNVHVPGGTFSRTSFHVPIPAGADATLRITRFQQSVPLSGPGKQNFGMVALLGNIAKLAWIVGQEKDLIRRHLADVMQQRHIALAHGASLDALGDDLRVPRFPARQYSFDPDTLALYHLDETIPGNGPVADDTKRFGLAGHAGTNQNAQSGVPGKFAQGFRFPGAGGTGAIEIADSPDFTLPANQSFTVEAFVKADANAALAPALILAKGPLNAAGSLTGAGWSVMIGRLRGISNNIRWAGSDGAGAFEAFADMDLSDGQFHHAACLIDRNTQRARLMVDGEMKATADISTIGALTNALPIRMGSSTLDHQFLGVLDEVRLSRIVRTEFDPALGEGDSSYRRRLQIFRSWQLPTPAALLNMINSLVQINNQPDSFILIEKNKSGAMASAVVRVIPASLLAGQSISKDGSPLAKEQDVSGSPDQDTSFQSIYLQRHDNAQVDYGGNESNRQMQAATVHVLDNMLDLLARAAPAIAGKLVINKSLDAADAGLHRVGRALQLRHETLSLEKLSVFTHRADFGFVSNDGVNVHASVIAGEQLDIAIEPRAATEIPPDGSDLFSGHVLDVHLLPQGLPTAGLISWTVIPSGGQVSLLPHPADPNTMRTRVENRPRLRLKAESPGDVTLRVEYTLHRQTVIGTRTIQVTIDTLADGATITADGDLSATETATVGVIDVPFNPDYLVTPSVAINFGADPNNKRMQLVMEKPLLRLLVLLQAVGVVANNLEIVKSFDPGDSGLHKTGRAIRFRHAGLDPGKLAALAHQAEFDFVRREVAVVYCSVNPGEKIEIAQAAALTALGDELTVDSPIALRARFTALPAAGSYNWSAQAVGSGSGSFDFVLRPQVKFTPKKTGWLALNLTYQEQDPSAVFPYTFEIRLKSALDLPGTIIPKPQYDVLMNILNFFHPIGVEVITKNIREHVVEVRENLMNAFPGYTYPDFRV